MTFVVYACPHCGYTTEQPAGATVEHLCPQAPRGQRRVVRLEPVEEQPAP